EAKKAAPPFASRSTPGQTAAHAQVAAAAPLAAAKPKWSAVDWFGMVTISAIVVFVLLIVYRVVVPSESKLHDRAVSAALLACQRRIAGLADYGGAETPPYATNHGKGDEFYFAWQRGSFH